MVIGEEGEVEGPGVVGHQEVEGVDDSMETSEWSDSAHSANAADLMMSLFDL